MLGNHTMARHVRNVTDEDINAVEFEREETGGVRRKLVEPESYETANGGVVGSTSCASVALAVVWPFRGGHPPGPDAGDDNGMQRRRCDAIIISRAVNREGIGNSAVTCGDLRTRRPLLGIFVNFAVIWVR